MIIGLNKICESGPSKSDVAKFDAVINDKKLPDTAEAGMAYHVRWADGRATFSVKSKAALRRWIDKASDMAEVVSVKYGKVDENVIGNRLLKEEMAPSNPEREDKAAGKCPECGCGLIRTRGVGYSHGCNSWSSHNVVAVKGGKNVLWDGTRDHWARANKTKVTESPIVQRVLAESIRLKSFDEYAKLVAKAYDEAPAMDEKAKPSWDALSKHIATLFKRLQGVVKVEWVDEDPYPDAATMQEQVKKTKVLKIWKGGTSHPTWSGEENLKFRAVHDYYSHIVAGQPFGVKGEIRAYNTHAKMAPPAAIPALFTEIIGQACTAVVTGAFPAQKIAVLPGFDYIHLGRVDGHEIVKKELVAKKPTIGGGGAFAPTPGIRPVAAAPMESINEEMFTAKELDLDKAYGTFKASYEKQTGAAWDKDKFLQRISNWTLFGTHEGFVAVRKQASGPMKLVGAAGDPKGVQQGFKEVLAQPGPVWGLMDPRLAAIAGRMGMVMPPKWILKSVFSALKDKMAPALGVDPSKVNVNSDGSLTIDYPDVGKANKVLVGNKAYFEWLIKNHGSAIPAMIRVALVHLLTTGKPPAHPENT